MFTCPYCKSIIKEDPHSFSLSRKQYSVYKAILEAGPDGINTEALLGEFFEGKSPITLRSCIYNINKVISPMRIRGNREKKSYSIVEERDEIHK